METDQILEETPVQDMKREVDVANLHADIVVTVAAIGEVEVMKAAIAEGWDQVIQEMEVDVVNQDMEIARVAIGVVEAVRVVAVAAAVIPMINISEEDNQDAMIITVQEEAVEMKAVEVPAREEAAQALLPAGVADAAIGNLFSTTIIKQ